MWISLETWPSRLRWSSEHPQIEKIDRDHRTIDGLLFWEYSNLSDDIYEKNTMHA
ncbi:hypothetical protein SAMN05421636_101193 [Pricia antarctica]|uniref:Uncharacterized protein n=1 Tax=Pricia antarctica TaxID=641691 RepID=A0A1G6W7B2_9FLAO|nr:hypothetical protein SAMN05421636_101193 [Pricia antarctica]